MLKRTMLKSICALPLLTWAGESFASGKITDGDVSFDWNHTDNKLNCILYAPTKGWLAVGFNSKKTLKGTRFVIAALKDGVQLIEERIALVPTHDRIDRVGLSPTLENADIHHTHAGSQLRFTYPSIFSDQPDLSLAPTHATHLMLAWSQEADFDHHSAWRKHYDIVL